MSFSPGNPLSLGYRILDDGEVLEALPNLFSVRGQPFEYRTVSVSRLVQHLDRGSGGHGELATELDCLEFPRPSPRSHPLTSEMVAQCQQAIGAAFPEHDTEAFSQPEGVARLIFSGYRDIDGSVLIDQIRATVRVVEELTRDFNELDRGLAIDLAWLHRLHGAGRTCYFEPITEGHLRRWGLRFQPLAKKIAQFGMAHSESAREWASRLARDDITRTVALASVVVSECASPLKRRSLREAMGRFGGKIMSLDSVTGPVLDILGWESATATELVDLVCRVVDDIGVTADVLPDFFTRLGGVNEIDQHPHREVGDGCPVKDHDNAERAVSVVAGIYHEALRVLGESPFHSPDILLFEERRSADVDREEWAEFVGSINPGAAEAFVDYYFPLSGLKSLEDFEHYLGQMVARFDRLYQSLPTALRGCPELIWALLAPFAYHPHLFLGNPLVGWMLAGQSPYRSKNSNYLKQWTVRAPREESWPNPSSDLVIKAINHPETRGPSGFVVWYSRHRGDDRERALGVQTIGGELWLTARRGSDTFVSMVTASTASETYSGPLGAFQPFPVAEIAFPEGNALEAIVRAWSWMGFDGSWEIDRITLNSSLNTAKTLTSSTSRELLAGRPYSRSLILKDGAHALSRPQRDDGLSIFRFRIDGVEPPLNIVHMKGATLLQALSYLVSENTGVYHYLGSEPAETALNERRALAPLSENPLLGSIWGDLASEILRVITRVRRRDFWRLGIVDQQEGVRKGNSPYIQVMHEDDGSLHLEVGPTQALDMDDPKIPAMMEFMGWSPPEDTQLPNFWRLFDSDSPPAEILTAGLQALTTMFGVGRDSLFVYSGVGEKQFNRSGVLDSVPMVNGRYVPGAVGLRGEHRFVSTRDSLAEAREKEPEDVWRTICTAAGVDQVSDEPLYAAIVDDDDPRAVVNLIALVPPGADRNLPEAFHWAGSSWIPDDSVLGVFLTGTPPTVVLHGDTLADVAQQISYFYSGTSGQGKTSNDWRWLDLPGRQSLPRLEIERCAVLLFDGASMREVANLRQLSLTQQREVERAWLQAVERIQVESEWFIAVNESAWWMHPQLARITGGSNQDGDSGVLLFDDPGVVPEFAQAIVLQSSTRGGEWELVPSALAGYYPSHGDRWPLRDWPTREKDSRRRMLIPEGFHPGLDIRQREEWGGPLAAKDSPFVYESEAVRVAAPDPPLAVATDDSINHRIGVWFLSTKKRRCLAEWAGTVSFDGSRYFLEGDLIESSPEFRSWLKGATQNELGLPIEDYRRTLPSSPEWFTRELHPGELPKDITVGYL